jgi:hypothetical protein
MLSFKEAVLFRFIASFILLTLLLPSFKLFLHFTFLLSSPLVLYALFHLSFSKFFTLLVLIKLFCLLVIMRHVQYYKILLDFNKKRFHFFDKIQIFSNSYSFLSFLATKTLFEFPFPELNEPYRFN